jgi:hypothetical protein
MPTSNYPTNYKLGLASVSKQLNIVFEIEGVPYVYSLQPTFHKLVYGDPYVYGGAGIYYGASVQIPNNKVYVSDKSSMTISQRLEPEQGRASTSTFSVVMIDKNAEISNLVGTGGTIINETMGRACIVRVGFANTSYPQDYYVAFRGIINNVQTQSGMVTFSIGDANQKRRQAIFQVQKTNSSSIVNASTLTIPTNDASLFYQPILGPDSTYDSNVTLYCTMENEVIQYTTSTVTQINAALRGARGTTAATHAASTETTHTCQINGHPLTLALKLMLSGWNGPYITGLTPQAVGTNLITGSGVTNAVVLPIGKSATDDYGLTIGDYVTVSGSVSGNNGTYRITAIEDTTNQPNGVLRITSTLTLETGGSLAIALRSKYDTLPTSMGLKLTPKDVDVAGHEDLRDNYLNTGVYVMNLYINEQQVGKDFIEQQLYYPVGCYSLTRYGQLSVNETKAPIATVNLQFLNLGNIIGAENITNTRGLNSRKFFNQIQFQYDVMDDNSTYQSVLRSLDTTSLNLIGILSLLPINSQGLKTSLGAVTLVSKVSTNLLNRYKRAAYEIALKVNFQVGSRIEAGDVIALQDNGYLQITDFNTGLRNLGTQLYEVTDRSLDLKTGEVTLKLVSGITGSAADRFGTVSPSSIVSASGVSTTTSIKVDSSYNATSADETLKWKDYIGQTIRVRADDFSASSEAVLSGTDNSTIPYTLNLSSPLSFTPTSGMILEIPQYPTSTNAGINSLYKAIHGFADPTIAIVSGASNTVFTVSSGDISKFNVGAAIYVRSNDFSTISGSVLISAVNSTSNTVTVQSTLGFTPTSGYYVELVGFADKGAGYRIYG